LADGLMLVFEHPVERLHAAPSFRSGLVLE